MNILDVDQYDMDQADVEQTVICKKCGEERLTSEFYKSRSTAVGRRYTCKYCDKATKAAYYEKNKQKFRDAYKRARARGMKHPSHRALPVVYRVETPDGHYYIGSTKRKLAHRLYSHFHDVRSTSLYGYCMAKGYTVEDLTTSILFTGSEEDVRAWEKARLAELLGSDPDLINVNH